MKDSTKAIFDSSWRVFNGLIVETEDGVEIASVGSTTDAHRIARLPELYEMLGDLTAFFKKCLVAWSNGENYEDFFSGLYFKGEKTPPIQFIEALNLLDKVAKGK